MNHVETGAHALIPEIWLLEIISRVSVQEASKVLCVIHLIVHWNRVRMEGIAELCTIKILCANVQLVSTAIIAKITLMNVSNNLVYMAYALTGLQLLNATALIQVILVPYVNETLMNVL
ncbi:uncharacterized protein LOC113363819 [Ctenocephalides felis]|uniref:uncharacterized protein LOC113363819 n=1 Tax=Ctenocephalides felis TaxID=7515 RepID=UPI000E6E3BE4|nr:uncharacterized protein LOC113363819 [Ctenocephalides felis]